MSSVRGAGGGAGGGAFLLQVFFIAPFAFMEALVRNVYRGSSIAWTHSIMPSSVLASMGCAGQ